MIDDEACIPRVVDFKAVVMVELMGMDLLQVARTEATHNLRSSRMGRHSVRNDVKCPEATGRSRKRRAVDEGARRGRARDMRGVSEVRVVIPAFECDDISISESHGTLDFGMPKPEASFYIRWCKMKCSLYCELDTPN